MSDARVDLFSTLLEPMGPVAITIKQSLAPANDDDPVIFPPSYPMTTFRGRVHTVVDGDYRVSVELPPDSKRDKNERSSEQKPGYNIDRFPDGTNTCEIDSPQSQANRIEPMFKLEGHRRLVPQIEIKVGTNALHGTTVNLLDAGHRAADAVVRMSSLADKFHTAFLDAKVNNQFTLATLAPTSLLFGVWDSRSTYVKVQRIIKAHIRASNVYERTRSAQFTPAADYVAAGAVDEALDSGEGDKNALSGEGMKYALATQTAGGVMLTKASELARIVNINLAALRELRGEDGPHTRTLQRYILGLALVAAISEPDLNLREGCNLRLKDETDDIKQVPRRGEAQPIAFDSEQVQRFAEVAAEEFFKLASIDFDRKDHLDAVFESGVAEEFLAMSGDDRKKISQLGPITAATIMQFNEEGKDPFKPISDLIKVAKGALGKNPGRRAPRIKNLDALRPLVEAFEAMSGSAGLVDEAKSLADELAKLAREHEDSHEALKTIDRKLREFKKAK
jgi:CRISPR-associated protein Csb1